MPNWLSLEATLQRPSQLLLLPRPMKRSPMAAKKSSNSSHLTTICLTTSRMLLIAKTSRRGRAPCLLVLLFEPRSPTNDVRRTYCAPLSGHAPATNISFLILHLRRHMMRGVRIIGTFFFLGTSFLFAAGKSKRALFWILSGMTEGIRRLAVGLVAFALPHWIGFFFSFFTLPSTLLTARDV